YFWMNAARAVSYSRSCSFTSATVAAALSSISHMFPTASVMLCVKALSVAQVNCPEASAARAARPFLLPPSAFPPPPPASSALPPPRSSRGARPPSPAPAPGVGARARGRPPPPRLPPPQQKLPQAPRQRVQVPPIPTPLPPPPLPVRQLVNPTVHPRTRTRTR